MEDAQILSRIQAQDTEGLAMLEAKYGSFIRYIVRSVLAGYPEEIEECVNDMWLKLWEILPAYEPDRSSLKTYLARITRNAALDRKKALDRRSRHIEPGDVADLAEQSTPLHVNPTEEAVLLQEQKTQLNRALNTLSAKDRELFLRKYYYLQTAEQIAAETGHTRRAVESRLARIKAKLAKALKEVS